MGEDCPCTFGSEKENKTRARFAFSSSFYFIIFFIFASLLEEGRDEVG